MLPTKVEIKLKKAEPISWGRLDYPYAKLLNVTDKSVNSNTKTNYQNMDGTVESVDLGDLWFLKINQKDLICSLGSN